MLASRIGRRRYDMWFDQTARMHVDGNRVHVKASSQIVADWIGSHFAGELRDVAVEMLGDEAKVELMVEPSIFVESAASSARGSSVGPSSGSPRGQDQLPDAAAREHRGHRQGEARRSATDLEPDQAIAHDRAGDGRQRGERRTWWRRFEDFVVGDCNRLAYEAALRIGEADGQSTAGMAFLHGECGIGKTHLLQAACLRFSQRHPRKAVRYTTGEQFTNEYIAAVRTNTLESFRAKVRRLDLLAIDDVHFLANKTATQTEFLHTMDAIDLSGARLMMASDEHPRLIKRFSQGLVNRFLSGMVVRVEPPDRPTRLALIQRLAEQRSVRLNPAAIEVLASRCLGSVRELEGALTKLSALRMVSGREGQADGGSSGEIGMILVDQLVADQSHRTTGPIRIEAVIVAVISRLSVDRSELMGSGRHRRVVLARGLVAYLARELTTMSFPEIARSLGRDNHSTAHTADGRVRQMLEADDLVELETGSGLIKLRFLVDEIRHAIERGGAGD